MQRVLASGGTNLTKSPPCFISPRPGSRSGMPETTGTVELSHFPFPLPVPFATLQSHIWQHCVHAGKHKWTDEDEMWANAPHLPFRLRLWKLTLSACWEVLCWLQEELPIDPTSTFPIQWSCSLILRAMLIQGYNLHSTDKSGSILRWGLWDQCASTETCWLFSRTNNSTGTVIFIFFFFKPELKNGFPAECKGGKLGFVPSFRLQDWKVLEFFMVLFLAVIYMT